MQIEDNGYYRDQTGRIRGPMKLGADGRWGQDPKISPLSWYGNGRYSTDGDRDLDLVERVYISTTPPVAVKIDEASLSRVKRIITTIEALRDGTPVSVNMHTEIGARIALSDYYKKELRALGMVIE